MKPVIFLSHSKPNKPFVRKLADRLKGDGVDVWLDELEIKIGESIHQKVNDGLKKSDFFALVLSQASVKSKWVNEELSSASSIEKYQKKGIFILPILIEECDVPPLLLDRRYANFEQDEEAAYQELVDSIFHHFEETHPDVKIPEYKSKPLGEILYENIAENREVLNQIPPRLFEELIGDLFKRMGYDTELTAMSRDGGYDIIATKSSIPGIKPETFLIQCKRYSKPVGESAIRELAGLVAYRDKPARGMLVTSSNFTRGAVEIAKHTGIDLIDGNTIKELVNTYIKENDI